MKNSTPIILDRLAGALQKHGVRLKRMQLLQAVATAFGHRNMHELASADEAGDLRPPAGRHLMTAGVPGIGTMVFLQDPDGNVFAVDQGRLAKPEGRAGDWITSPFGGLLDVTAIRRPAVSQGFEPAHGEPFLRKTMPGFTNGCSEVAVPGRGRGPIDPEQPAYMTSGCCEVATVTQDDLESLGLPFGSHDGGFYPLTDEEARYIAEDVVDADDGIHGALTGYAVIYRGAKHLMPTIEIANGPDPDYDFPSRDEVLAHAIAYADRIRPRFEAMGGNVLIDTDQDDRVLVMLPVPIEAAMAIGDEKAWHRHLAWLMVDPDLPTVLREEIVHEGRGFKASVSWIGEGDEGDYDPNCPGDKPLLRFDAMRLVDGEWEDIDCGSYCTQVPAWSQPALMRALTRHVVETLEDEGGTHPKRLLEQLSWIDADTVEIARRQQLVLDAMAAGEQTAS